MRSPFPNRLPVIRSLIVVFAFSVLASAAVAHYLGQQQHPAGTETTHNLDDTFDVSTYDDKGWLVERKEYNKNKKLHKRTTYKYLKDFKEPDTSTTTYQPDGKTPGTTTSVDHDKDGNPTITVKTYYDKDGNEISGTKREHDPKTGKDRCYKWDPKKQEHEEVPCDELEKVREEFLEYLTRQRPKSSENARVETASGLLTVIFNTPPGQVRIYLPDDMRAGDTISGTVIAEPKGQTKEERAKNLALLGDYFVSPGMTNPAEGGTLVHIEAATTFTFDVPSTRPTYTFYGGYTVGLIDTGRQMIGTATVPIEMVSLSLQSVAPLKVAQLPSIGQTGRPIEVFGPFGGNSSNTTLNWTAPRSQVQDFEKNTENVSGGFGLIAESPRKCIFTAPTNVTGPIELQLKEGKTETKGTYRNIDVKLTAPKTNLMKGEHTELHVEVTGLQGIKQPVPLTLDSTGVITMEGGMYQPLMIQPSQVGADGRYTTTRGITGLQAGGWGATATVVVQPFDICLQDDNNPRTVILFNSFTGDYKFTAPVVRPAVVQPEGAPGQTAGTAKPSEAKQSAGTTQAVSGPVVPSVATTPFPSPIFIGPATGTVTRNGCTITLNDNRPDRVVIATVDMCTHTGTASVQTSPPKSPKIKFTITDRNTTDNTCTCGPGCR